MVVVGVVDRIWPYGVAAPLYRAAGWVCVLPLPYGQKAPPPKVWLSRTQAISFIGHDGVDPDQEQVNTWLRTRPGGNVALRPPHGVLGLDLDLYKPAGRASYTALVDECGPLPPTWSSSARDDGSGIYWFTVPAGVPWAEGRAGEGIELITRTHRYAVVWPSRHRDTGTTYQWWTPDGQPAAAGWVPRVYELPALPTVWGRRLSQPATPRPATVDTHAPRSGGYAAAALAGAVAELSAMREGSRRNNALNRKAFHLGGLVAGGALDHSQVRDELLRAAEANGHVAKHGLRQTLATINSGLRAGAARPRRTA
jgi:hypothetical protein